MRLLRIKVIEAATCGGLLDGLDLALRDFATLSNTFDPLCLIGANGAGKSQFLQLLAEIFLSAWHTFSPDEEAADANPTILFELEYALEIAGSAPVRVRLSRARLDDRVQPLILEIFEKDRWKKIPANKAAKYLPPLIVGYTSGENETLSLPFAMSRLEYAERVGRQALEKKKDNVPDTRLLQLDYSTHLEVLVANLLLGNQKLEEMLLSEPHLFRLRSFRCVVQLSHRAAPTGGVQLTTELASHIESLRKSATCWQYDEKTRSYIFDFFVEGAIRAAFRSHWKDNLSLYRSLHKLAMLNDLTLPKYVQTKFRKETESRHFATRKPEPPEMDKVFRFERVTFLKTNDPSSVVDYVSLSDGEHQLVQVLGILGMIYQENALFIWDEPESHFNPQWRVRFIQKLRDVPTPGGRRADGVGPAMQELLLTTHAPFVPSDMPRENVLVFAKSTGGQNISVSRPEIETFGTTFDRILEHCFSVHPPISKVAQEKIDTLLISEDVSNIEAEMAKLGSSIEKTYLAQRVRELKKPKREA